MFQEKALSILKSGKNVFLTGSAGTGKTYTLNAYIQWLKEHKVPVAITASTGIAATHMNGTTIHSWSGIGIKNTLTHSDLKSMQGKQYLTKNISKTHVLIIDEISMLHRNQLDMINQALKYLKNSAQPFGGMQVVFAGDFFQLPPVSKESIPSREKFAFMSKAWVEAAPVVCYLTEQYRQTKNELNTILNQIRGNEIDESGVQLLQETRFNEHTIEPTKLYSHNADVDAMNEKELGELEEEKWEFFATKKGNQKMMESFVKSLIVQGTLLTKDLSNELEPQITLKTNNTNGFIRCGFKPNELQNIEILEDSSTVSIKGICKGMNGDDELTLLEDKDVILSSSIIIE